VKRFSQARNANVLGMVELPDPVQPEQHGIAAVVASDLHPLICPTYPHVACLVDSFGGIDAHVVAVER
jgi:hypothetical protein